MAVLQNGPDCPSEFYLENADAKLRARMVDPSTLEVVELQGFIHPDILSPISKKN
jgi:hypothetical protein